MKRRDLSVNFLISLVILLGFLATATYSYLSYQTLFRKDVEAVSELTSENIYVNINNLMDRPMNVSITMANDTFLRSFMDSEERDENLTEHIATIQGYLRSYQQKYDFDSVFFVSTKTGYYYHYENGIDRVMTQGNPENDWYYAFLQDQNECSLNVDNDEAKRDVITIFVNCKLYDESGNVLGVVGVGMETPYIQHFLEENEADYGIEAYLIDAKGKVQISSQHTGFEGINLFEYARFDEMQEAIVHGVQDEEQRWYHSKDTDGYIISKYVPNLNWYLVVEKSTADFQQRVTMQIVIGFAFMLLVVSIVITLVSRLNKKNKAALLRLSQLDQLTGIKNRTSYEQEIEHYRAQLDALTQFGIGVFDLNHLKLVNDAYGHQAGDIYIKTFSDMMVEAFQGCAVYRIGGDEFALIFANMTEAEMLDSLAQFYQRMEGARVGDVILSAAFGYAFYDAKTVTLGDIDLVFKEADNNMYCNKASMKREQAEAQKCVVPEEA